MKLTSMPRHSLCTIAALCIVVGIHVRAPAQDAPAQEAPAQDAPALQNQSPQAQAAQAQAPQAQSLGELQGKHQIVKTLQIDDRSIREVIDLLSEISGLNIVATQEAAEERVTLSLREVRVIDAIEIMAKISGLWYREEEDTGAIRLMTTEQYQRDLVVFRDDVTRVFTLLHPNALSIAQTIQSLYGPRVVLSLQPFDDDLLVGTTGIMGGGLSGVGGGFGGGLGGGVGGFGAGGVGAGGLGAGGLGAGGLGAGGLGAGGLGVGGLGAGGYGAGGLGVGGLGVGGLGGGMGGLGAGGLGTRGFGAAGSAFARGGGQAPFLSGAPLFNVQPLPGDPLTAEQVAQLQNRIQTLEDGQQGISAQDVQQVTAREPLIYVAHNKAHSLVIVRTSDVEAMKSIERLILELDRPTPEVLLEMKILQITLTDNFRSILDLQYTAGPQGPTGGEQQQQNPFLTNPQTAAENVLGLVNSPELSGSGSLVYQFLSDNVRARLELLQEHNLVTSLASPVLLSSNNRPARIFVGEERVLVTGIASGIVTPATGATTSVIQPETEVRDIGTSLIILPKINADRSVTLSIAQDQSEVIEDSQQLPVSTGSTIESFPIDSVRTSNLQATVVAHDGLTIAVGGLVTDTTNIRERRVPGLHKLPLVGHLFRQSIDENVKTELILLITPHVITTPMESQYETQARLQALSDHPSVRAGRFCPPPTVSGVPGSEFSEFEFEYESLPAPSHQSGAQGRLPAQPVQPGHPLDATAQPPWREAPPVEHLEAPMEHLEAPSEAFLEAYGEEVLLAPEVAQ